MLSSYHRDNNLHRGELDILHPHRHYFLCVVSCIKIGFQLLRNPLNAFIDSTCTIIPEWNLHDLGGPNPDFFLDMLRRRATTSIYAQYCDDPVSGARGDAGFILDLIKWRNLRHPNESKN